jgi:hypothetical protein
MKTLALVLVLLAPAGAPVYSQQTKAGPMMPEVKPTRGECAIFLPERDERHDLARLVRADQFLDCERDGFPKHLAPPWKEQEEAENKLSDACVYFTTKSVQEHPQVGHADLQLASERCQVNVMTVILERMVADLGSTAK